ncbi:hypothetical protein [Enterocloster lavalensis]|uniref:hypothetical protein n=1 Tax=Enterocloster lavalensis TaxID=460384 RepID=UPI002665254B|nr:hypothetical protein [Enterocloster lavalensis]
MEKDYKKTGWVNGSEPDMDAEHMNNIEDGIDGLYHPEFDDSGTVGGITSFPAFLSTVINKMNPIAFYKNFKAGMKYVLHTGSLINNGLCTETGKYAADATQLNPNIENTLAWQVAKVNSDLAYFVRSDITYNDYVTKLAWSNTIIGTEQFFVITIAVTSAKIIPASTIIGTLPFNVVENSVPVLYQDSYIIAYGKNLRIEKEIAAGTTILAYIPTRILK